MPVHQNSALNSTCFRKTQKTYNIFFKLFCLIIYLLFLKLSWAVFSNQYKSLVLDAIGTLVHFSGFSYFLFRLPLELLLPLTDIVLNTNVIE